VTPITGRGKKEGKELIERRKGGAKRRSTREEEEEQRLEELK